jgi:hypothetical protein
MILVTLRIGVNIMIANSQTAPYLAFCFKGFLEKNRIKYTTRRSNSSFYFELFFGPKKVLLVRVSNHKGLEDHYWMPDIEIQCEKDRRRAKTILKRLVVEAYQ